MVPRPTVYGPHTGVDGAPSTTAVHRPAGDRRITDVPPLLQVAVHLLVGALLVLAVVHAALSGSRHVAGTIAAASALAIVYGAGPVLPAVRTTVTGAAAWLGGVLVVWLALLWLSPDAIWLAFPWFFLLLHLLPWRPGLIAVGATTAAAIAGFAWHQGTITVGTALGPVLGALVAIATVWGYTSVAAESERRRSLIAELRRTRAELAVVERSAGAMAERERLAREIHDTLAQGLSSIQLLLRAAARTLPTAGAADPDTVSAVQKRIEQAREAAQDNLEEARRFVAELTPPDLHGRSLPAALDRLCRTTSARTGLPITFAVQAEGQQDSGGPRVALPTPVEVALLRIAQSAVANVTAHAAASRAAVTLTVMDTAVTLDIVDDGRGFDPDFPSFAGREIGEPRPSGEIEGLDPSDDPGRFGGGRTTRTPGPAGGTGGFGLPAMRSRAAELGGTFTVESAPGRGAAVAVMFPLPLVAP